MAKYRRKPYEVDAMQFDGSADSLAKLIDHFGNVFLWREMQEADGYKAWTGRVGVTTKHGVAYAEKGDWIIQRNPDGARADIYPCKPALFAELYENVAPDVTPKVEVYSRSDCVFHYCPHEAECRAGDACILK